MINNKIEITQEVLDGIKNKIEVLFDAIAAEKNLKDQVCFRMAAAKFTAGDVEFQLIIEVCTARNWFLTESDIQIMTDPGFTTPLEPYKTLKPGSE